VEFPYKQLPDPQVMSCAAAKRAAQTLGEQLRHRRVAAGLTLEEVFHRTYIPISTLDAIERGELGKLPGGYYDNTKWTMNVYVKGFIRAYAKSIGFEGDPLNDLAVAETASSLTQPILESRSQSPSAVVDQSGPPKLAQYLLYLFLTKPERIYLIGDLEEEYSELASKFGVWKAKLWFYKQVFDSLRPLMYRSLSRIKLVIALAEGLNHLRRMLS